MFTEAFQKQMNALSQHIRIQVAAHDLRPGWAREREDPAENPDTQHTHMHLYTHVRAHTHACTHRVHTHKLMYNHVCRTCLHARFTHTHTHTHTRENIKGMDPTGTQAVRADPFFLIWVIYDDLLFIYFWLCSILDLSSLTRNRTHTPCIGRWES